METTFEDRIRTAEESGVFPQPVFRMFLKRELKMAFRFRYPLCLMLISVTSEGKEAGPAADEILALVNGNIRRGVDIVSEYIDGTGCYLLCPYSNLPVSFIIAERIKLLMEAQDSYKLAVKIAGVEVDEGDGAATLEKLEEYCFKTVDILRRKQGSGALIYAYTDLKGQF